ncbi:hypothetical protein [Oscillatoria sp. FACHB-1406]|uniref:hypothetical protein n=1 Tax=Oscillatoria sp. FACHB-1406 TaxID=2692846 RepID=UPI0016851C86|nr:hypothetical protein [Oscillatoria sp. FACHB-1406]MBD2580062.1 hypothetical protein [Oscillatoria sp. FACHB-1406]
MSENSCWYLGIDLGANGLRAVLLQTGSAQQDRSPQYYPLHWRSQEAPLTQLPAVAYLDITASPEGESSSAMPLFVGSEAIALAGQKQGVLLDNLKLHLNFGIPYYARGLNRWEPLLQVSSNARVSLDWVQHAVGKLFATLQEGVGAIGLSDRELQTALATLTGVVLSCPAGWNDAYRFNLREAVLQAGLVEDSSQIFLLEEAIAALLGTSVWKNAPYSGHYAIAPGMTLILHGGALNTELALGLVPQKTEELNLYDFAFRSVPYGGRAIAEDLFYQLIYPQWQSEQPFLEQLNLELPEPGQPAPLERDRAYAQLLSFPGGRRCLETAERAWRILQHQSEFSAPLGTQTWSVRRADFEERVIAPYLGSLNRELNALLGATGLQPEAIARVTISGNTALALTSSLQTWLSEKLVNAEIVAHPEPADSSTVAIGLARLPFFPQACDRLRHQYSDYFLLNEILQVLPNRSFSLEDLMQRLEGRGINTRACQQRLFDLLNGYLPPGLVPTTANAHWLTLASQQNRDYQRITIAPLFVQGEDFRYRANGRQCQYLRQYFAALLSGTRQKLEEPAIVTL